MKNRSFLVIIFATLVLSFNGNAFALTCIKATSKIKNGKVTTTLASTERTACKKGEIPAVTGAMGAAGAVGATGATGPIGPAGPTYIRHTQNPGGTGITTSDTEVATFGLNANYSGSYSPTITHPDSAQNKLFAINVQAHLDVITTGATIVCTLQANTNGGSFVPLATTTITGTSVDGFMNVSVASFSPGTVHNFRTVCRTNGGGALVAADMGAVAGVAE